MSDNIELGKIQCPECASYLKTAQLLKEVNPFDQGEVIYSCPNCKSVIEAISICDERGCYAQATFGWSFLNGYRRTCGRHMRKEARDERGD